MIIVDKKDKTYFQRVLKNLFQNWGTYTAIFIFIATLWMRIVEFSNGFNFKSILAIGLLSSIAIFYALYESIIHIQQIEIRHNDLLEIRYLRFNKKLVISEEIDLDRLRYRVRHNFKMSLADRLTFIKSHKVLLTQYFAGYWKRDEMNEIIIKLNDLGFKRPYGDNSQKLIIKNNP